MFSELKMWIGKLLICVALGTGLMLFVYALPTEAMRENVSRSSEIFDYEGVYPQLVNGYKYMQLDNYTDSIMLGAAIYDGNEGIINKAMKNYHIDCDDLSPELALTNYSNHADYDYYKVSYERYWHGYLVPLKILLLFFDYADIRVLNYIVQGILLITVISLFYKAKLEKFSTAFLCAILVINPMTTAVSLQYSSVYIILLLVVIYLLEMDIHHRIEVGKVSNLFFLVGVTTSFFDFFTYPFATFGFLIVLYINMKMDKLNNNEVSHRELIRYFVLWSIGYIGMWAGKWGVGSILLRENLFANAMNQAMMRLSSQSVGLESYNRFETVLINIRVLVKWPFVILLLGALLFWMIGLKRNFFENIKSNAKIVGIYLVIAIMPFVWIILLSNHSREHYWFTYKELSVSCFAIISLLTYLKKSRRNKM